jgi:hypothetical protein
MVRIKVLNEKGHEEIELAHGQAAEYLQQQIASGKWAFVDGVFQPRPEIMEETAEVIITMKLMGG